MIDYKKLVKSQEFYLKYGFNIIETPWLIKEEAYKYTAPPNTNSFHINFLDSYLVASAEQGFLQLIDDEKIKPGKYQSLTPCFRDDEEDDLHCKYFMKNELIEILPNHFINSPKLEKLNYMIDTCLLFFKKYLKGVISIQTKDDRSLVSFDLQTISGIELGSYGIRKYKNYLYIYGTGCAEPRLTTAVEKNK